MHVRRGDSGGVAEGLGGVFVGVGGMGGVVRSVDLFFLVSFVC